MQLTLVFLVLVLAAASRGQTQQSGPIANAFDGSSFTISLTNSQCVVTISENTALFSNGLSISTPYYATVVGTGDCSSAIAAGSVSIVSSAPATAAPPASTPSPTVVASSGTTTVDIQSASTVIGFSQDNFGVDFDWGYMTGPGAYLEYQLIVDTAGSYQLNLVFSAPSQSGIDVTANGAPVGSLALTATSLFSSYGWVETAVILTAGPVTLRLTANSASACNLAGVSLTPTSVIPPSSGSPTTSWFGNTWAGADAQVTHVQDNLLSLWVSPDGKAYSVSYWDESGCELSGYQGGQRIACAPGWHGWGTTGGYVITGDSNYIYATQQQSGCNCVDICNNLNSYGNRFFPPCGTSWESVVRLNFDGSAAPFDGGFGGNGNLLVVESIPDATALETSLFGLAVLNNELYVADVQGGQIVVYSITSFGQPPVRSWPVTNPGPLAVDGSSNIWMIQRSTASSPATVICFSPSGQQQPQQLNLPMGVDLAAMTFAPDGTLWAVDQGIDQQIKIYNQMSSSPTLASTFGVQGGILSGVPGQYGDLKFNEPTGVGFDSSGNIYVTSNGLGNRFLYDWKNSDLRAFSPSSTLLWRLVNNEFRSVAVADPATDGRDVYSMTTHYVIDYSQPPGQQWRDVGYSVDRYHYPSDLRVLLSGATFAGSTVIYAPIAIRNIQGTKLMFAAGFFQTGLAIYRFDGEIAVPSGLINIAAQSLTGSPANSGYIWRDSNGNGQYDAGEYQAENLDPGSWGWAVDENGNVWRSGSGTLGVFTYPLQGLDSFGNPIYTVETRVNFQLSGWSDLRRVEYSLATDTLVVGGFLTGENDGGCWAQFSTMAMYSGIASTGAPSLVWVNNLPFNCSAQLMVSCITVAGPYIFGGMGNAPAGSQYMRQWDLNTGQLLQTWGPDYSIVSATGWMDFAHALRSYQHTNGAFSIFVEDDWRGKILLLGM